MRKIEWILGSLLLLLVSGCWPFQEEPRGRLAMPFGLKDPYEKTLYFQDLKGKFVILHFWASWCPPCLGELPEWIELARKFQKTSLVWVAVSLDKNWNDVRKIFPKQELPPHVIFLLDSSHSVSDLYGAYQFPETFLIDSDRKIKMKWVGSQPWNGKESIEFFKKLVEKES